MSVHVPIDAELLANDARGTYEKLPTVYLDHRRPCFLCSKQLLRISVGRNKGRYAAKEVEIDGIVRYVHGRCGVQDHEFINSDDC